MKVTIEYGYSPGLDARGGFWIWQQIAGGPASGVENILWTHRESIAIDVTKLLNQSAAPTERLADWMCRRCRHENSSVKRICDYCGTKPE